MTVWVFGDSWPAGCELKSSEFAFPTLIEQQLNVPVKNLSIIGTSQETMIEQFHDSQIESGDVAIFSCTAKTRRVYRTKHNLLDEIQFTVDEQYVNPYEDERVSAQCCSLLYYMTIARGGTPYFLNQFDTSVFDERMWKEIPEQHWLIPKDKSIISMLFDPDYFNRWNNHTSGDWSFWLDDNNSYCKKYIRPLDAHPNQLGHQVIADFIVSSLVKKGHFNVR